MENEIRIQKFLSDCGICSRRKAEEFILQGKISVNKSTITSLGVKINPNFDVVELDGKVVSANNKRVYIMLNKPKNVVTTLSDEKGRKTVKDLLKSDELPRVYPVGRLDYDSEGLLLLTNDGELTYRLTHPKHNIPKIYIAKVMGLPNTYNLISFENGIEIDGYITAPAKVSAIKAYTNSNKTDLKITIYEGRNRQIRKMCEKIGHPVLNLKRIAIGDISLEGLEIGKWRYLSQNEINYLKGLDK